jgi:hypothetical protein
MHTETPMTMQVTKASLLRTSRPLSKTAVRLHGLTPCPAPAFQPFLLGSFTACHSLRTLSPLITSSHRSHLLTITT